MPQYGGSFSSVLFPMSLEVTGISRLADLSISLFFMILFFPFSHDR